MHKSGFVSIIGRPNVGKSTLLNALVRQKLCAISEKPETTRDNIKAIVSEKDYQIVFIDTPGIHRPKNLLGKSMVQKAASTFLEADVIVVVIEAPQGITQGDIDIFRRLPEEKPCILAINKIDIIQKPRILPIIEEASPYNFKEIIPISATRQDGITILLDKITEYLPEGGAYFPDDQLSDKNERFFVQEIIREKILELLHQELPYSIAVKIEEMKDKKDRSGNDIVYIRAVIYAEKDSQKGIIIGKDGRMLKRIGEYSRRDIEYILRKKVFLDLWVKVYENWRKNPFALKELGYQ